MTAVWTAPRTWNVGEVVTASLLNTHLRDNLEFLKAQVDAVDNQGFFNSPNFSQTTSSTSFVDATNCNFSITPTGAYYWVFVCKGMWSHSAASGTFLMDIHDSVLAGRYGDATNGLLADGEVTANMVHHFCLIHLRQLTAVTRTMKIQIATSGATLTLGSNLLLQFFGVELRR